MMHFWHDEESTDVCTKTKFTMGTHNMSLQELGLNQLDSASITLPVNPPAAVQSPSISKAELLRELAPYATSDTARGLKLVVQESMLYLIGLGMVLFAGPLWLKIVGSILAGFKLTSFHILAHDAVHRSLVVNSTFNKRIAMVLAVPALHNYRLWVLDHLLWHHSKTNGEQVDLYRPFSKAEFDALPKLRQLLERIVRYPNVIGFALNFFVWWLMGTRVVPDKTTPASMRSSAWRHFLAILCYHLAFAAFLCSVPHFAPVTLGQALSLGLGLPLFVFSFVMGTSLYVMHTNPRLPWFRSIGERTGVYAPELCASHMILPDAISKFVMNVFAHSAHHAHPGIPVYNLLEAQKHLDKLLGHRAVAEPFSIAGTLTTMRTCKLYDFERHQWLDFAGNPTAASIRLDARGV